ncbi:hypothetical protein CBS101457_005090 [Exobasidium rhododendri]|nr:hypothetical protein CBS101457_005090 [Exobasidium rhododendri]
MALGRDLADIAIVGSAFHLPSGAGKEDLTTNEALWEFLSTEQNSHITKDSPGLSERQRFLFDLLPKEVATSGANFYRDSPCIDEVLFHVNTKEAAAMDDQIKDLYHVSYRALESAGYKPSSSNAWNPEHFGCFVGTSTEDYTSKQPDTDDISAHHLLGTLRSFQSGRLSHCFGWKGPSAVYDSGCASSFTALHSAWQSLQLRDCSAALVGASHVATEWTAPTSFVALQKAHFLTTEGGQCKPFSTFADGYCRAEGTVVMILKRLDDAQRDGDRILGVIKGSSAAAMSSPQSITRPMAKYQSMAMDAALRRAKFLPDQINYIEAHGPGTLAGDPQEFEALSDAFLGGAHIPVGSIKGNVGHSEAASGLSSLLKVLLQLDRHEILPFTPANDPVNPALTPFLDRGALRLARRLEPWVPTSPRRALINNFGAAGAVHCVSVEEAAESTSATQDLTSKDASEQSLPFVVSAPSLERLQSRLLQYREWLSQHECSLTALARTLALEQQTHKHQTTVVASNRDQLLSSLSTSASISRPSSESQGNPEVVFVFAGQGKAALDPTTTDVYVHSITFKRVADQCLAIGYAVFAPEDHSLLWRFTLQYAQACTYKAWGVDASAVAAHSFGEYAMMVFAGVLSLHDALRLLACRARLVRERCSAVVVGSAMLSIRCQDERQLESLLASNPDVAVSCRNNPKSFTLSGRRSAMEHFKEEYALIEGTKSVWLDHVDAAYHNRSLMEPVLLELSQCAEGVSMSSNQIPVLSTVHGRVLPANEDAVEHTYFVKQTADLCDFAGAVEDYQVRQDSVWLELGSDTSTLSLLSGHDDVQRLGSMNKGADSLSTMITSSLKAGAKEGAILSDTTTTKHARMALPPMPFITKPQELQRKRRPTKESTSRGGSTYTLDRETLLHLSDGHTVGGADILPAGAYIALLASAVNSREDDLELSAFDMPTPFIPKDASEEDALELRLSDVQEAADLKTFSVLSTLSGQVCARGTFRSSKKSQLDADMATLATILLSKRDDLLQDPGSVLDRRLTYDLFSRTVDYGEKYRRISKVYLDTKGTAAYATIPSTDDVVSTDRIHHSLPFASEHFDSLVHVAGLLVNTSTWRTSETIFVAHTIDRMRLKIESIAKPRSESGALALASYDETLQEANVSVFVFDEHDRVYIALQGLTFKRMPAKTLTSIMSSRRPSTTALYTPDQGGMSTSEQTSLTQTIGEAVARAVDLKSVQGDDDLEALGLDSISSLDLVAELREVTGQRLPLDFALTHKTLGEMVETLVPENLSSETSSPLSSSITCSNVDTADSTPPNEADELLSDPSDCTVQLQSGPGSPLVLIHE